MKVEIEVTEEDVKAALSEYVPKQVDSFFNWKRDAIRQAAADLFKEEVAKITEEFQDTVRSVIRVRLLEELDKAADKKLPGWVKNRVKQYLKDLARNATHNVGEELGSTRDFVGVDGHFLSNSASTKEDEILDQFYRTNYGTYDDNDK